MRLEAAGVICMEPFKDFPQMGRFTLRDEGTGINFYLLKRRLQIILTLFIGRTIAIGKVLKVIE